MVKFTTVRSLFQAFRSGVVGGFGIEYYIIIIIKYIRKKTSIHQISLEQPYSVPWHFVLLWFNTMNIALNVDQACSIDMALSFTSLWTDTKSKSMTPPPPPRKKGIIVIMMIIWNQP